MQSYARHLARLHHHLDGAWSFTCGNDDEDDPSPVLSTTEFYGGFEADAWA
jgi:hypothetical protein